MAWNIGLRHRVKVGDAIGFEIEDVVPFGIETGEPARIAGIFHPSARTSRWQRQRDPRINAFGIGYDGKSGLSTFEFSWAALGP
jgi:hypothetical protein